MRHKFNAIRVECDEIKFPSKLERDYYLYLMQLKAAGEVVVFLRQTPFHLPGNIKYTIDFQVFWRDGTLEFIDVKGQMNKSTIRNIKMVEDLYWPIKIKIVRRGEF